MTLTPEQIDSRMAQLGGLLFDELGSILQAKCITRDDAMRIDFLRMEAWEGIKSVAEQAKKGVPLPTETFFGDSRTEVLDAMICQTAREIEYLQAIKKELEAEYQRSLK